MKRLLVGFVLVLTCFLSIMHVFVYAATVDGFLEIPWGASKNQVITAMQDRGFKVREPFDTHFWGEFAGYSPANLAFSFERNGLYEGQATMCHTEENTGYNSVQTCGQNFENMLRNKYGAPAGRRQTHSNAYMITWEGISTSKGSDNITITLWVSYPDRLNGGLVQVTYKNNSLLQRLKQAGKSDI